MGHSMVYLFEWGKGGEVFEGGEADVDEGESFESGELIAESLNRRRTTIVQI